MDQDDNIQYLDTNEYRLRGGAGGAAGKYIFSYTRQTRLIPDRSHLPVTNFLQDTVQASDQWFDTHSRLSKYQNIVVPMTTVENGVIVQGHMVPWSLWCKLALKHFRDSEANEPRSSRSSPSSLTPNQWKRKIIPYIRVIFKGILKSLTLLHRDGMIHGSVQTGIFVRVLPKEGEIDSYMNRREIEGFLGNIKPKVVAGDRIMDALIIKDQKDIQLVIYNMLKFIAPSEDLQSINDYLQNGNKDTRRFLKLLEDLKYSTCSPFAGYYSPFLWTKEEEVLFLDRMHFVLFRIVGIDGSNKTTFDDAFKDIPVDWKNMITDQTLTNVLNYQSTSANRYVYETAVCLLMFYRNGGEHLNFKSMEFYGRKIQMLKGIEKDVGQDIVKHFHSAVYEFNENGSIYMSGLVDLKPVSLFVLEQLQSLLVDSFCRT